MRPVPAYARLVVFLAMVAGAEFLLAPTGGPHPHRTFEFSVLVLAAILIAVHQMRLATAEDRGVMPPAFVLEFTALLLFGVDAALFAAAAGILARWVAVPESARPVRRTLLNATIALAATEAAGSVRAVLGGASGQFIQPVQAASIAAAAVTYCLVRTTWAAVIVPRLNREPVSRSWPIAVVRPAAAYGIGAAVAAALAQIITGRMWELAAVAALPLYCAYRAYCDDVNRCEQEHRRGEVIGSLSEGVSVVDRAGRVTLWDATVERLTGCPRQQALGRPVDAALPMLAPTQLARTIQEVFKSREPRMLTNLAVPVGAAGRVFEVQILPVAGGAALLWHDITARTQAEQSLKRSEERLALAAAAANDGLWEWDVRTQAFFASARWNALIGLPAGDSTARPEQWLDRVHADDVKGLREAVNACLSGATDQFQHEHRICCRDGSYRRFLCRGAAARTSSRRVIRLAGSLTDTTDQALTEKQLRSAGFCDPLTGLCNRAVFVESLGRKLAECKQQTRGDWFAALYLDLDRFKIVNDSLGHLVGDELLVAVSRRLESCLREGDELARLGGDEFAILLNDMSDPQQANAVAFRIQKALGSPFSIDGREVFTSASIGIAFGLADYNNPDEIMRDADTAMYHAKSRGKARHELFDADMHARARDRLGLENDLRRAIDSNNFEVHYQPIVLLASRMCVGFESLIRWTRNGEPVSPATFIPMAEELGLIEPLGTWVLQQACRTFADWQRQFPGAGIDCITVNVSSRQLMQQHFMLIVEQAVEAAGLRPCDLRLEITETALMDSPHVAAKVLSELREFGVKIYLDDFGTGYSSLSHLHKLPVDALKIDRSFVKSLIVSDRPAIVESILALARTLNTSVVAEGIESDDQARELERLGCTHAQGFLFSRPLSSRAAEQLLLANRPLGPDRSGREPAATAVLSGGTQRHDFSVLAQK